MECDKDRQSSMDVKETNTYLPTTEDDFDLGLTISEVRTYDQLVSGVSPALIKDSPWHIVTRPRYKRLDWILSLCNRAIMSCSALQHDLGFENKELILSLLTSCICL